MKEFMKSFTGNRPELYWLRLEDGMFGNFKPADGILFSPTLDVMIEFKLERRVNYAFKIADLPEHQRASLAKFEYMTSRLSAVLVYHVEADEWHLYRRLQDVDAVFPDIRNVHSVEKW